MNPPGGPSPASPVPAVPESSGTDPAGSDSEPLPGARRGLVLLFASRISRGIAAGIVTVAFPYLILTDLRAGAFVLGILYAGGALATALLTYSLGRMGSRRALRGTYLTALALLPVACGLLLLPASLPIVFLASIIGGFSATGSLAGGGVGGAAFPLQSAVLSDLTPGSDRTRWFSWFTFGAGISASAGALVAQAGSLTDLFAAALVLSAASVLLAIPVPVRPIARGRAPSARSRAVIYRFTATGILNGVSQGLLTPFLIPFFVVAFGVARPEMAIYTTAGSTAGTFAVLAAPALDRRWGFVRSIVGTRLLSGGMALAMPFVPLAPALALYILLPVFRVMALPAQSAALMGNLPGADRSEGAGTNQAARVGAASGATAFSGFALEDVALSVPFLGYAAAVAANAYLYVHFFGWRGEKIASLRASG
ncbi:MAG: MFS transporter [Thermoplasmata archaeon]